MWILLSLEGFFREAVFFLFFGPTDTSLRPKVKKKEERNLPTVKRAKRHKLEDLTANRRREAVTFVSQVSQFVSFTV